MNADSPRITSANRIERLQQAVRVMAGLSDSERANFDIHVFAVRRDSGLHACIAGFCGLDPWFQAQGLSTTVADNAGIGNLTGDPEEFFGTERPFYRSHYSQIPPERQVTVEDAITSLRREIDSLAAVPSNAESATT